MFVLSEYIYIIYCDLDSEKKKKWSYSLKNMPFDKYRPVNYNNHN